MNKKVLITGIAGFIGKYLTKLLLKNNFNVHGIVQNKEDIKDLGEDIKTYQLDLADLDELKVLIDKIKPNYIVHLAALTDPSRDIIHIKETFRNNTIGTLNLLMATKDTQYEKLINVSTAELYSGNCVPFKEDMVTNAVSPYSASKICAETYCNLFAKTYDKPITTLRFFLVYGYGQLPTRFIPYVIDKALKCEDIIMTKGEQKREFTYIEDAVLAIMLAMKNKKSNKHIINIGTGMECSLIDIARKIVSLAQSKSTIITSLKYRKDELMSYCADVNKAKHLLGWTAKTSLDDGLLKTIERQRSER
jgi:UDP-glucose 4-epimerase